MEAPNSMRLPLLELSLDPYLEGGSKGPTPRGKPSSLKRARSPAPSSSSTPQGPEGWLSPLKRRVLIEEGLISPRRALTTPGRRLFAHVDDKPGDERLSGGSPLGRPLFSARDIEPGIITAFANSVSRGLDAAITTTNAKRDLTKTIGPLASRDDVTLVDATSCSSPATLASSPSNICTPRTARSHASPQPSHRSIVHTLEPSPEIKATAKPSTSSTRSVDTASISVLDSASITMIKNTYPSSSHGTKMDIPLTYSSNPTVPLDAPELHFTRPTLEDSMTFMEGSRHYPGFVVRADTPSPRRESSASEASSSSSRSTVSQVSDAPSDSECSAIDEEDEDKENTAVVFLVPQRMKRKKFMSREGTPAEDVATSACEVPAQTQTPERASKRARTTTLLLPHSSIPINSRPLAATAAIRTPGAGRDATPRREGHRRLLEIEMAGRL